MLALALQAAAGAAEKTFTWEPPTQNTDGSPVTPLAGYTLTCGELEVQIPGGATTTYKRDFGPGRVRVHDASSSSQRPGERAEQRSVFYGAAADSESSGGFLRRLIRRLREFLRRLF